MTQELNNREQMTPHFRAFALPTSFCNGFFQDLLLKTFEGVGVENAKKMTPQNTLKQTHNILESFVKISFADKFSHNLKLVQQKDFKPPEIDNMAIQQIEAERVSHLLPIIAEQVSSTNSRIKSKKAVTQKSIRSRKFTQIPEQTDQLKSKQISHFSKLPEVENVENANDESELNKIKNSFFNIEKEKIQREKQFKSLQEKGLFDRQRNAKIVKDMKRITYDYEGKLVSQAYGITQPEKLIKLKNKFGNLTKTLVQPLSLAQQTQIQTNRKKESKIEKKDFKEHPMFRQEAQSIIQTIENSKGLAAGVKIVEEVSDKKSITKQNPLKKPNIHSLVDFKNTTKQSRFKQYRPVSLNKEKLSLDSFTLNNEETARTKFERFQSNQKIVSIKKQFKSKSTYSLIDANRNKTFQLLEDDKSSREKASNFGSFDEATISKKIKYKGLPFIKTKGYKAIDIASQKSFKIILDEKMEKSKLNIRSRILINDLSLLKATLEDM